MAKLYAKRDRLKLNQRYVDHVMAMTCEELHRKSDIAAELAWRDSVIATLLAALAPFAESPDSIRDDFICHAHITTKFKCVRCSRAIAAFNAMTLGEQTLEGQ